MTQSKFTDVTCILFAFAMAGCAKSEAPPAAEYPKHVQAPAENPPTQPAQGPVVTDEVPVIETVPDEPVVQPRLRDAQIVKIADAVNTGEVEQAKLAKQRARSPAVKKFASQMVTQHTAAQQQGLALAKQTKLEAEQSSVSEELASKGSKTLEELKAVDAAAFDRTYMASQVQQHQEVLEQLDSRLIPEATNARLKAELQKTRTMVEAHLNHARQIEADM